MSNYTQQKFRLRTVWGQTGDDPPGSPLELPLVGGIMPMIGEEMPLQGSRVFHTHRPKTDEVLQWRERHKDAVDEGVGEKQQEELVVGETYTVVYPDNTVITISSSNFTINVVHNASRWSNGSMPDCSVRAPRIKSHHGEKNYPSFPEP